MARTLGLQFRLNQYTTTDEVKLKPTDTGPDNVYVAQAYAQWRFQVGGRTAAVPNNINASKVFVGTAGVTPPVGNKWIVITEPNGPVQPVFDTSQFNTWLHSLNNSDWR
jgi:hypothetical protein